MVCAIVSIELVYKIVSIEEKRGTKVARQWVYRERANVVELSSKGTKLV